jgi:hypothetical protein
MLRQRFHDADAIARMTDPHSNSQRINSKSHCAATLPLLKQSSTRFFVVCGGAAPPLWPFADEI